MVIKTKYKFGDIFYLKNDVEQLEYLLIAVIAEPGGLSFRLRTPEADIVEVYEFEVSEEKDPLKTMGLDKKEGENDE